MLFHSCRVILTVLNCWSSLRIGLQGMSRDTRIYVGNLPNDVRERDLEDIFEKYGKIKFVDVKSRRGPPFAFVEFEDPRDAEDAVRGRDGYDFDGYRIRVEFPRGAGPRGPGGRPLGDRGDRERGGPPFRRGGPPQKRTGYRVMVTGLPPTGSWQDLKDHMRDAGDVCYADVYRDGTGVVEYTRYDDVRNAIRKLDDTKFRSHEGETSYVRVKEDDGARRSRSPAAGGGGGGGGGRRGSPDYSPRRSRSRSPPSRSRSRSPRSKSRSRSRSRSRS